MSLQRITERTAAPFTNCRADRAAGAIHNVLICGTASANGRDYPVSVFKRDFAKYENRPVNCDHGREATVERRFGWFSNVRPGPDGRPRGTLNCLKSHPMYERVMEAAERNPALFGFSHVAMCRTRPGEHGREVVEAIESVESIDLVAEPATTKGLFENRNSTVKTTLRNVIRTYRDRLSEDQKRAARQLLLLAEEDAGMNDMMDAPVDQPPEASATDPDQAINDAFKQAMHAQVDALLDESHSLNEFIAKIRELYKSRAKLTGSNGPDDDDTDTDDSDSDDDETAAGAAESRRRFKRIIGATTRPQSGLIIEASGPTSVGRSRIDPGLTRSRTLESRTRPPSDGRAFAEFIQ
jgi:hypothetical protein